ncbi:sugar transporter [Yoonia sp. I 8.24]|uniref:sugar transporter n=1 Tax=Yoonia sp. I 8.24 TaxID=1537229 RepID=UPI001EDFD03C|nr:sugar transporter [Yoonia sp. I 8.24]MCG3266546.1 sugar transporter [Yoonia sp. I 8.24]
MDTLTQHINTLADHLLQRGDARQIVAITGAPACGKSTLAAELARRLTAQRRSADVVEMDGFHLDNAVLADMGLGLRKGAPETFDSDGFIRLIRALKSGRDVYAPRFDRTRDLSIAGAIKIPADTQFIIVEGNYLMFDEDPWRELPPLWNVTARLEVAMPELRARLIHRWLSLNHTRMVATRRAEGNDIPNAQRVIDHALPCDFTLNGQPTSS